MQPDARLGGWRRETARCPAKKEGKRRRREEDQEMHESKDGSEGATLGDGSIPSVVKDRTEGGTNG